MKCRHCGAPLKYDFVDLATAPPSNAYLSEHDLSAGETFYPLKVLVCSECWLVQTQDFARADELFNDDYAYFSSFSKTWLEHSKNFVSEAVERFEIGPSHRIVEVAANDGYLLQYVKARGIPCYGIEPTASTAAAARAKGLDIVESFFGTEEAHRLAEAGLKSDLMVANNVLAHVPDINDFVAGFSILLTDDGIASFEFPHLLKLAEGAQFDTIYHEHYSYLSLGTVSKIFDVSGLSVFDVEELPTHGGSLRVWAQRKVSGKRPISARVATLLATEAAADMNCHEFYGRFQAKADKIRDDLLTYLINARKQGHRFAAYGAAAKGNTLLNYAGIRSDMIEFVVDRNPHKQGKFLPGSRIPISNEERLWTDKPDRILILPWNLTEEIVEQLSGVRSWGARFVRAVPEIEEIE